MIEVAIAGGGARTAGRTRKIAVGAFPMALTGLLYVAMGRVRDVGITAQRVHLCDIRAREIVLFGIPTAAGSVTPSDWLSAHPSRFADALCALPYATFVLACLACALWLHARDHQRMLRFGWSFLALNVIGFATYHLYPVAPPWYFHAHGCAVLTTTPPSEGPALARFDAWTGVPYFARMYARSSAVFGAMPSLHVGYSLLVVVDAWRLASRLCRAGALAFFFLMCFAAVYLDHHWIQDVVVGAVCSLVVALGARAITGPSAILGRRAALVA